MHSLLSHNTFGIDTTCRRYAEYASAAEAAALCRSLTAADRPLLILGAGSNLLLTRPYEGTVISPEPRFGVTELAVAGEPDAVYLDCWAGTTFDDVVAWAVAHSYYGMENLSLIPGQVGASAVQNIGAYGAEASEVISSIGAVEIATGREVEIAAADCQYAYRQSRFKHEWRDRFLITRVTYRLSRCYRPRLDYGGIRHYLAGQGIAEPTAAQLREAVISIRRAKLPDPKVEGNAGSFFMNPIVDNAVYERLAAQYADMPHYRLSAERVKIPAGWMIEQCGWRGKTVGRVGVHQGQALVLVNRGGATGQEVLDLCHAVQRDVKAKFGIEIRPEVNIY